MKGAALAILASDPRGLRHDLCRLKASRKADEAPLGHALLATCDLGILDACDIVRANWMRL